MNKKINLLTKVIKTIFHYIVLITKRVIAIIPGVFKAIKFIIVGIFQRFKRLLRFSITFKITFVYTVILSLLLFLFSTAILFGFKVFLIKQVRQDIENNSQIIINNTSNISSIPKELVDSIATREEVIISFLDSNKNIIYSTTENKDNVYDVLESNESNLIQGVHKEKLVLNKSINMNEEIYYIQISKDLDSVQEYFFILLCILVILNIIIIIITMIIGSSVSKKIIRPIDDMTETVRAINIQKLDTRLNVKGSHDELKELAQTFNDMFDRIQESYERQNQFVSDASHELRTPIAVIQGYANLLDRWGKNDKEVLEESIEAIKSESENMKDLVEKLLFLARADKKTQKVEKIQFYLDDLIDEVVKETKLIDTKHEIVNKTDKKILIFADRKLLKQALRIFIDNSIKFTPENGSITIEGEYYSKDKAVLVIEDTGIGILKEDIPYIFNRFYRSDKSRSKDKGGTGLGLSIAKWIIAQHRGIVEVKSAIDVGTKISIFLPLKGS